MSNHAVSSNPSSSDDYERIADAIAFLRARRHRQPDLDALADHLGLSPSHTQRLFSRWAGISPKRFVQLLSVDYAKQRMAATENLLSLSFDVGLSGPGRLHDLFVNLEGMSPGEYRRAGRGVIVKYGIGETPFGDAVIAHTSRGICHLAFVHERQAQPRKATLQARWPGASLQRDDEEAIKLLARVFARVPPAGGLSLWISGSNFQIQVWRALLRVPLAGLLSYRALAELAGRPGAARAVGMAMARNPVAFLIPCHRVLRGSGDFGAYHWGAERKVALCAWEASRDDDCSLSDRVAPDDAQTPS